MSPLLRSVTYLPSDAPSDTNCHDTRAIARMPLGRKLRCHLTLGRGSARPAAASPSALGEASHLGGVRIADNSEAVDGHTLNCNDDRIRLLGIDVPKKAKCLPGRKCDPGDPKGILRNVGAALTGELRIRSIGGSCPSSDWRTHIGSCITAIC